MLRNVNTNFGFLRFLVIEVQTLPGQTDGQADRRTGKTRNTAYQNSRTISKI